MKSFYRCNVFFIVLDLWLTRLGLGGVLFFMSILYLSAFAPHHLPLTTYHSFSVHYLALPKSLSSHKYKRKASFLFHFIRFS